MWIGIRCARVIYSLHFWTNGCVFRLGRSDADRCSIMNQCIEFCRCLALQPNTTMCARAWVNEALVKSKSRREFAPESHRVADIAARNVGACFSGHDTIALDPKSVRAGSFVFFFAINGEASARSGFRWNTDRTR